MEYWDSQYLITDRNNTGYCKGPAWAPSQYPKRRLFVRSREVSKPRDWYFKLSYRFEIWQAHRQQCCRSACQISERSDNSKYKSRGFETLRDLTKRRLFAYWDGALILTVRVTKITADVLTSHRHRATRHHIWYVLYPKYHITQHIRRVIITSMRPEKTHLYCRWHLSVHFLKGYFCILIQIHCI